MSSATDRCPNKTPPDMQCVLPKGHEGHCVLNATVSLALFPRCTTCDYWNEYEDYPNGGGYRTGNCEHPRHRTPLEKSHKSAMSAELVHADMPCHWFHPGEDYGCVLHSSLHKKKRPGFKPERLKISGQWGVAVAKALRAGKP